MSDIAAEAGLGRVTSYGHFASRQVLIEAVVRRVLDVGNAALDESTWKAMPQLAWNSWSM
jgi:TetR/AcrR family transcriptional repressor of mexCD-oprJ operon